MADEIAEVLSDTMSDEFDVYLIEPSALLALLYGHTKRTDEFAQEISA